MHWSLSSISIAFFSFCRFHVHKIFFICLLCFFLVERGFMNIFLLQYYLINFQHHNTKWTQSSNRSTTHSPTIKGNSNHKNWMKPSDQTNQTNIVHASAKRERIFFITRAQNIWRQCENSAKRMVDAWRKNKRHMTITTHKRRLNNVRAALNSDNDEPTTIKITEKNTSKCTNQTANKAI